MRREVFDIVIIAALYAALGIAVRWLSGVVGLGLPMWPCAGIALVGTLVAGRHGIIGAFFGAVALHAYVLTEVHGTDLQELPEGGIAFVVALGAAAAVQAWIGAAGVRRDVGYPTALNDTTDLVRFLLLGGPVAALLGASIVLAAAVGTKMVIGSPVAIWGVWWVVESLAVLTALPVALCWLGEPSEVWRARRNQVAVPMLVSLAAVAMLFQSGRYLEGRKAEDLQAGQAVGLAQSVSRAIDVEARVLSLLAGVVEAEGEQLEHGRFRALSRGAVEAWTSLEYLAWNRRLSRAQRSDWERSRGVSIVSAFEGRSLGVAGDDSWFVVQEFAEPAWSAAYDRGFDLRSQSGAREALTQAANRGVVTASGGIRLPDGRDAFLLLMPVGEDGRGQPLGFVSAALTYSRLLERALDRGGEAGLTIVVRDLTDDSVVFIRRDGQAVSRVDMPAHHKPAAVSFSVAGRTWSLTAWPTRGSWSGGPGFIPLLMAVGGLLFVALLGVFLLALTARESMVLSIVAERTEALSQKNLALIDEVKRRARVEAMLREAKDAAERANRSKSLFLANMSHEIRTPMNGIIGMSDLLAETGLSNEQGRLNGIVRASGESLLRIINDILDFSKVEAGHLELERRPIDVRKFVEGVLDPFASTAAKKRLVLVSSIDPGTPAVVQGDPTRLRQVLTNLVGNSLKFTDTGEIVVSVRIADTPGLLHFEVRDTGIGMPEEARDRVFNAFTQVDASTTRRYGGTGLGLAICRRLTEIMGGQIGVESAVKKGSVFWFTARLPAIGTATVAQQGPPDLGGVRVLLGTANKALYGAVGRYLASWGLRVAGVAGAADAIVRMREHRFGRERVDVMVLDASLPGVENVVRIGREAGLQPQAIVLLMPQSTQPPVEGAEGVQRVLHPIHQEALGEAIQRGVRGSAVLPEPEAPSSERRPRPPARHEGRVLVAEDNPVNQMVVTRLLKTLGYESVVVATGADAVEAVEREAWDMVLMDCQMPGVDGFEATRRIRRLTDPSKSVPIIALTANAMAGDRARCLDAGMDDYLPKPLRREALRDVLSRWGRGRSDGPS